MLQTLTSANSIVGGALSTSANALDGIVGAAQSAVAQLITWVPDRHERRRSRYRRRRIAAEPRHLANSSFNSQYVFGGIDNGSPPMAAFGAGSPAQTALTAAFQTQFGFAELSAPASITSTQISAFLNGPFAAQFSGRQLVDELVIGVDTNTTAEISPGQTVQTSINLNSGGFQSVAQAYGMLSLFGDCRFVVGVTNRRLLRLVAVERRRDAAHRERRVDRPHAGAGQTGRRRNVDADDADKNADRHARQCRPQSGRDATQYAYDATRDRVPNHRATPKAQPSPVFAGVSSEDGNVRIRLQRYHRGCAERNASARTTCAGYRNPSAARGASSKGPKSVEAVNALFQLRQLWGVFLDDLKSPENALPKHCASAAGVDRDLGQQEIDRLRSGACQDFTPLIEINEIIRDGLN